MPEDKKKVKLTLTVRPFIRQEMERIAAEQGISVSELIENYVTHQLAEELKERIAREEAAAKAARKAAREAKKADEQVPGQLTTRDLGIQ